MSLSIGSAGSILFWMPSRPASSSAEKARYGLAEGSGQAELDPLGLRVGPGDRDPYAGRAVALGVDQRDRSLEAGHQAVVGVHRRVGEGQQRRGVLEDAADVPASDVREPGVAGLVVEQRVAVVPDRLVHVHAGAVVAEDRLRHEGRGLAVAPGDILDDVLELHHVVGRIEQLREPVVDLRLARGADLVVGPLDLQPGLLQLDGHLVAQLAEVIGGGDREVAHPCTSPCSHGCRSRTRHRCSRPRPRS